MTNFRKMMIAAAATGLMVSQAVAADTAALKAGKPAGVKEAQGSPNALTALVIGAGVAGAVGIALAVADSGACPSGSCPVPSASTTGTGTP